MCKQERTDGGNEAGKQRDLVEYSVLERAEDKS